MPVSSLTILGAVQGLPSGAKVIGPLYIGNTSSTGTITNLSTSSGDNTITVPSGAIGCVIVPPTTGTATLKLKGAAGDTGVTISGSKPSAYTHDTTVSSFILNSSAASVAIEFHWY